MAKQAVKRAGAVSSESGRQRARKLENARDAQRKAAGKVARLRARLDAAESKLAKRERRLSTIQARMQAGPDGAQPAQTKKRTTRTTKKRETVHERLAAIGLSNPEETAHATVAESPPAAQDGTSDEEQSETASEADAHAGGRTRKASPMRANHRHGKAGADRLPPV